MLSVIYDDRYLQHETGPGHPERAARLAAIVEGLETGGVARSGFTPPSNAGMDAVAAVHDERYIALVEHFCRDAVPFGSLPTGDTMVTPASFDVALLAAGGAISAVVRSKKGNPTLALLRPPGHHAEPMRGMGFCIFNNIAIAAQHARADGPVLIADFDYHHGNGTQAWVERALDDGQAPIGFISTHAYPAYPGTGAFGESKMADGGFIVDVPLAHSTGTDDFIAVWASLLPPLAARLRPATILVSAGFDFLAGDPIAGLPIGPRAVDALLSLLGNVATAQRASLALILEGGYSLDNLRVSGASLARSFASGSTAARIPAAARPTDLRLRAMTDEVLRWIK